MRWMKMDEGMKEEDSDLVFKNGMIHPDSMYQGKTRRGQCERQEM